jgi:hypothetical protein
MNRISTTTLATQNISGPLLIATHTADQDRLLFVHVYASGLAGAGDYRICVTKQLAGAGAAYQSGTFTVSLAAGVTTVFFPSFPVPVANTDVVKVYLDGIAADTSVAVKTEFWEDNVYAVVTHADYGNAKLLRSTNPAHTLAVSATGEAQAQLADAVVHGGSTASLLLKKATITATGNDAALTLTGSGTGQGMYVKGGATGSGLHLEDGNSVGDAALYINSPNGFAAYLRAGRVALNISGNELDGPDSAVDIYNAGYNSVADTIRIDHIQRSTTGGHAISIRNTGPDSAVNIESFSAGGRGANIVTADGDGLVIIGGGAGHYDINADIHGAMDGTVGGIAGTLTTFDALWAKIQKWLRLGFRKDVAVATDHATELAEINANTGTGIGDFDNTVESLEGLAASLATVDGMLDQIYAYLYGNGPITFVYTVYDSRDDVTPLEAVRVRVTTDQAGLNFICENYTNAFGQVTFHLAAGTYYLFRYRQHTRFAVNPDVEVVS